MQNGRRRVVITGLGAVTPIGGDVESTWQALLAGESGAAPITLFDTTGYPVNFACEVKDFDPTVWLEHKQARRMDRFAQFTIIPMAIGMVIPKLVRRLRHHLKSACL